ncbi:MAG TPA: HipA family kinase [Acidobacteriaceae bacterium]|nr:HipA family kinase [Acidobacteriaceae bacterium]
MSLRVVNAIRYISSLREGGSLPALVEAEDGGRFVVKLRGAGQGALALVAEVFAGEMARVLGLPVPEIALLNLDPAFGRQEPDPEIQDLFKGSRGLNVGLAFLPEATAFDPASGDVASSAVASGTVWLDAFTLNIDRTPRNANLLVCREKVWLIDHGAALYFHHHWPGAEEKIASPFAAIRQHILLPWATDVATAGAEARARLTRAKLERIVGLVPGEWLVREGEEATPEERRAAYLRFFTERLRQAAVFEEEIARARA